MNIDIKKNKYELMLGFVTIIISLSAFKDELKGIIITIGEFKLTLATYLLWVVFGLSICLYLYVVESIAKVYPIGNWKIFTVIINIAFTLFVFILLTPIILLAFIVISPIWRYITDINIRNLPPILIILAVAVSNVISKLGINIYQRQRRSESVDKEIKELDEARKLFMDGYYSQSVLTSFKVLESHLYNKLVEKNITIRQYNGLEIIKKSLEQGLIKDEDIPKINSIKEMRNLSAHSNVAHTKEQADFALDFINDLLGRK